MGDDVLGAFCRQSRLTFTQSGVGVGCGGGSERESDRVTER